MSLHYAHLVCFRVFTPMQMSLITFGSLCVRHYAFMFTYLCIELYKCDSDIYVICDMCALYFDLYICHVTSLCSFGLLPRSYSDANEFYYLYPFLFHIYLVHHVGLGHISLPNSFVLIVKSFYEPSMLKTSSLLHTRGCIVINHQKSGRLKASRPLVGFR